MKKILIGVSCLVPLLMAEKTVQIPDIPNPPKDYPAGKLGEYVKLGEEIIMKTNTHPLSKDLVGNSLKCTNCHTNGGKTKMIGTFIGTSNAFPAWSNREQTVQTLEDRINNCFMRSMNGIRPINGTKLSLAMASYISWLSDGLPQKMNTKKTINQYYTNIWTIKETKDLMKKASHENWKNGQKLYEQKCAACHQKNGQGLGEVFPPVWGDKSYNTGAGLSKLDRLPTWLMYNMPQAQEGTLSPQEAVDIALYVNSQPRPDFDLQKHLPKNIGHYNSMITKEYTDVRSNFKAMGLDLDVILGK